MNRNLRLSARSGCFLMAMSLIAGNLPGQVVPGTGQKLTNVGDDFEDVNWNYVANEPKASREQDGQVRAPMGFAANRRFYESPKRGQPDIVKRVATPAGGLPGSTGAMLMQSLKTGVPDRPGFEMNQDDFIMACASRIGAISVGRTPSCVTRVYLPPFEQWEDRTGSQFGFRADLKTTITETEKRGFGIFKRNKQVQKAEAYWPGFFIQFHSQTDAQFKEDSAVLLLRGDERGHEVRGPELTPGWWTLGMSFTPDGRVHYYAHQGVGALTSRDYISSSFPYGYSAESFATVFYNVVNMDNGRTWSTAWIVDDPEIFVLR